VPALDGLGSPEALLTGTKVGLWHLVAGEIGADCRRRHAEVGRHVVSSPPGDVIGSHRRRWFAVLKVRISAGVPRVNCSPDPAL